MHLRILLGHTTFHRFIDCSFRTSFVEVFSTNFEANGPVSHIVHHDIWSLGKSLHLPINDVASFFDGKNYKLLPE